MCPLNIYNTPFKFYCIKLIKMPLFQKWYLKYMCSFPNISNAGGASPVAFDTSILLPLNWFYRLITSPSICLLENKMVISLVVKFNKAMERLRRIVRKAVCHLGSYKCVFIFNRID